MVRARMSRLLRPFSDLGLQGRFMLSFGVIVVTLMAMVILIVEQRQSTILLRHTQMRGVAIATSIASVVKNALLSYDYVSLQQAAETATHDEDVLYVIILNKEGVVAGYSGQPERQGQSLTDPVSRAAHEADGTLVQRLGELPESGLRALDIAVAVRVEGTPVRWGTVRVGLSLEPLMETLAQTRLALQLLGAGAVIIVLLSARFLSRKVTGPLEKLARATAVIATGDLEHSVEEDLLGELGDLSRSFNKMTNDLKQSQDAIKYQNQHLENVVQLRTAALRQKAWELEKVNEELKELDRLKSDFLSNVSHELRTPLTSIRSFTEIMLDQPHDLSEGDRREFLEIVSGQAERLTRLISDLLDLSKIEAGEFRCQAETVKLQRVIEPCVETLRTLADEKKIRLQTSISPDLPPILADVDRLSQVMTNLVDNAIKFTPVRGTISVSARVSRSRRPASAAREEGASAGFAGMESQVPAAAEYVVVEVRDTGLGIPPDDRQRIFDKFGQVGNVLTDKPQGTGLGLAISGNIIVQHNGAIWVESAPGHGSLFGFSVPAAPRRSNPEVRSPGAAEARPHPGDAAAKTEEDLVLALERTAAGKQILVVDDEPPIVVALTELLQPLGYRTVACRSGSEAVAKARQLEPDAVILDIMMPEIDGYDVLRLLKGDPATAGIPVIVLSVLEDEQKALELGAAEYIRKPFDRAKLLANVRALV